MSDSNQSLDHSTSHETCALKSSFDVSFNRLLYDSMHQDMEGEKNILPLNNLQGNSTYETLFQEYSSLQHANNFINEVNEGLNNLPQMVIENITTPAEISQSNTDGNTTMNE